MQDAWRAYIDLALGMTESSRRRATQVVRDLYGRGNTTAEQLQTMGEELVRTGLANREALTRLVRFELDRALGRVGLATAEEVQELTGRVRELEGRLAAAAAGTGSVVDGAATATHPVAKKTVAKKTVAKKTVAKKVAPAAPSAQNATPTRATAKKATAKKAAAPAGGTGGATKVARKAAARKAATGSGT